jgi:hypothetical protein
MLATGTTLGYKVGAMVLHGLRMITVFIYQAQCAVQLPAEPRWAWLWRFLSQLAISVIPVAGGVCIAVWSFRRSRQFENEQWHRNQEAAHEQWVRDESKAEWRELLSRIASIEHEIPVIVTGIPKHENLESIVLAILPLLRGTIFIYPTLESSGFIAEWQSYVKYVSGKFQLRTQTNRAVQTDTLGDPVSLEDKVRWRELSEGEEIEVRDRFHAFIAKLRGLAYESFGMNMGQP